MLKERVFERFPTLKTERLILRPLNMDDCIDVYEYARRPEVAQYVTWDAHESLQDTKSYLLYVLQLYKSSALAPWAIVLKSTNRVIGTIDFTSWDKIGNVAEIGYAFSSCYWGQGYGTEAAKEIVAFGFNQMELIRIQARCITENIGSARVMEKMGMSYEGTLRQAMYVKGKQCDIKMYSILKNEWVRKSI